MKVETIKPILMKVETLTSPPTIDNINEGWNLTSPTIDNINEGWNLTSPTIDNLMKVKTLTNNWQY